MTNTTKYQKFLDLIAAPTAASALTECGAFKEDTLAAYAEGRRKARAVTIMLAANILGVSWDLYV